MLAIGKAVGQHGEVIAGLAPVVKELAEVMKAFRPTEDQVPIKRIPEGSIESTIEHDTKRSKFSMKVVFEGDQDLPYEARKAKSEQFLADMEVLLNEYSVLTLNGSYAQGHF